ncbi:MAG: bifunctional hydroxymethylpyrimidine kinase/phosphomethylpyrimidine kinase [Vampirovibrionales bacterium]
MLDHCRKRQQWWCGYTGRPETFNGLGVYGCSIITASTAQNTLGVQAILPTPLDHLGAQWSALHGDLPPAALKIGMVGSEATLNWLLDELPTVNACKVFDSRVTHNRRPLLARIRCCTRKLKALLPLVDVVTPNISEAERCCNGPSITGRRPKRPGLCCNWGPRPSC